MRETEFRSFRWISSSRPNEKPEKEMRIQWSGIPGFFPCWFCVRTKLSFGNFGGGDSEEDLWHFARQGENWNGIAVCSCVREIWWKSIKIHQVMVLWQNFAIIWAAEQHMEFWSENFSMSEGKAARKLGFIFFHVSNPRIPPRSDLWAYESQEKNPSLKVENLRHIDAQGFVPDEESSRKPTLQRCWCTRKLCRSKRGRTEVYHAGWWFIWCLMIYDDLKLKSKVSKVKSQSVWRRFGKFLISSAWSWLCVEWIEYLADA